MHVLVPVFETLRNRSQLLFGALLDVLFADKVPQLHGELCEAIALDEVLVDGVNDDLAVYQHLEIDQLCIFRDSAQIGASLC